jgi:TonB family protein
MRRWIVLTTLLLICTSATADTWSIANEESTYYSPNKEWRLVLSKNLPGQPGRKQATLYRKGSNRRVARWVLVNDPLRVFVAHDGTVATVDTCCSKGYGNAVIVIYRPDGTLVRQMALSDFLTAYDISVLEHTVSSIWWDGTNRIDEENRQLVLQVKGPPQRVVEIPISLDTGQVLTPIRRHFWITRVTPEITYGNAPDAEVQCEGGMAVTSADLLSRLLMEVEAKYPPIAIMALIHGAVIVQVSVDENGAVDDVKIIKPLPFGVSEAAVTAVREWQFRPTGKRMCGQFSVNFGRLEEEPQTPD